ncbi:MAG: anthranilate phosphoribosyltransferase [Deltaproteobacteria bacterium]|nr:MAG: anthranilate phosphoribosyltransferase [Deltaproteobacteria bacterium]
MIRNSLIKVMNGRDLSESEMEKTMADIFDGRVSPAQAGAFVTALRYKEETVDEIVGAARALAARVQCINLSDSLLNLARDDINIESETVIETSDSGKTGTRTFNISTATAFVLAGSGVNVVRHGNRSASMYFGAADVLMNLEINLDLTVPDIENCIQETGVGFLFTTINSGPMKHVAPVREEIGIRTIFNLIGPLANPARSTSHILGVYKSSLTQKMADVLNRLGAQKALVTYGHETHDEVSICGPTDISRLKNGQVESSVIEPEQFGFKTVDPSAIAGGNARENARIIRLVLDGERGPKRDVVLLNAAAALVAARQDISMEEGIAIAAEAIDSGMAKKKLRALVDFTAGQSSFIRKAL